MEHVPAQPPPTQYAGQPNPLDKSGLCLLSLDGGGVRGLSTLYILKRLMTQLNQAREAVSIPRVKPCEVFDLIGGTGTGGYVSESLFPEFSNMNSLIAIMLGRLQMEIDECIEVYNKLMKAVFEEKSSRVPVGWKGKLKAQFDSDKLQSAIEEVVQSNGASSTDAFNNGKLRGCRT